MITYQYEEYKPVRQIWTWLAILLLAVITLGWAMVTHMRIEPKILPYQALLPAIPQGVVPVGPAETQNPASMRNPLPDTEQTRRIGQAYYSSYCLFCHGKDGHGDGPVGQSTCRRRRIWPRRRSRACPMALSTGAC
jgi:hypothetical protein